MVPAAGTGRGPQLGSKVLQAWVLGGQVLPVSPLPGSHPLGSPAACSKNSLPHCQPCEPPPLAPGAKSTSAPTPTVTVLGDGRASQELWLLYPQARRAVFLRQIINQQWGCYYTPRQRLPNRTATGA